MPQESLPGVTATESTGRKHAYGERGHHVGRWPKKGPFTILVRDRARKDANAPSKGEKFYNCDLIRAKKEPKIGFNAYLGARHGEGWYKIVSSDQPRGALFRITERMEETARKRYPKLALEDGDEGSALDEFDDEGDEGDEDEGGDEEPEPARANPDPIAAILEQRRQYEQLAKLFEPRDNPSPLAAMLANPAALGVLAKLFEAPPKPPPQAPQLDPEAVEWLKVAAELRARNLTPADALAAFQTVPPPGAPVADGDGVDGDGDGPDGEDVGPDGEPIDPFDAARARYMRPR